MKLYIVICGKIIIGDNSLDFAECNLKLISDFVWADKVEADKFAKKWYMMMKEDINKEDIRDVNEEFCSYRAEFIDAYGDTANEIYAYVKELQYVKKV